QLSGTAATHSARDRGLSDRSQRQQVPVLPCARAHRRIAGANGVDHALHGPRRPVPRLGLAAPLLLHEVPRPAAGREAAAAERLRRHRYAAQPCAARRAAMTAMDEAPAKARRGIVAFALELRDVLHRPSSVFGLGVLVLAGFVAGVIFWGAFNTALELTN